MDRYRAGRNTFFGLFRARRAGCLSSQELSLAAVRERVQEDFTGVEFLRYAWRRRHIPAIACAVAVALAAGVSLLLPERYTATATILIEPPAGNDPRAATAVSTVYLESLRTYEHFVASDTVFARALDKLELRQHYPDATTEELKRKLLNVSKPVNTSLIQVSATLPFSVEAQRLAQTIAEDAVALNTDLDKQSSVDILREPTRLYAEAKARRERAEQTQGAFLKDSSVLTLDQRVANATALRSQVNLDLARERTSLAAYEGQRSSTPTGIGDAGSGWTDLQISAAKSRIRDLEGQEKGLSAFLDLNVPAMEKMRRREEAIETELRAARAEEERAMERLREIQSSTAIRRTRITVLDPGIVPQKPSFPNIPLNIAAAFLLALVASFGFLAVRFSQTRLFAVEREEPVFSRV